MANLVYGMFRHRGTDWNPNVVYPALHPINRTGIYSQQNLLWPTVPFLTSPLMDRHTQEHEDETDVSGLEGRVEELTIANQEIPTLRQRISELGGLEETVAQLKIDIERLNTEKVEPKRKEIMILKARVEELTLKVDDARRAGVEVGRKESEEALRDLQKRFEKADKTAKRVPTLESKLHETAKQLQAQIEIHLNTIQQRGTEITRLNDVVIHGLNEGLEASRFTVQQQRKVIDKHVATIGIAPTHEVEGSGHLRTICEQAARIKELEAQVRQQGSNLVLLRIARRYTVGFVSTILSLRFLPLWILRNIGHVGSLFYVR